MTNLEHAEASSSGRRVILSPELKDSREVNAVSQARSPPKQLESMSLEMRGPMG